MAICFARRGMHLASPFCFGQGMKKVAFDWTDPLLLEASLREEERLVRDSARGFAQARLMPLVRDMHRQEAFDPALLREMGALGLLGSTLEEFGG